MNLGEKIINSKMPLQLAKNYYFSRLEIKGINSLMQLKFRYLGILACFLMCGNFLHAQQAPIFTHHTYTHAFTNPGFAGMGQGICLSSVVRQQWAGFKDSEGNKVAPETFLITGDMPVKILRGGVGLSIIQDKLGFEKIFISKYNIKGLDASRFKIEIIPLANIEDVLRHIFG